MVPDIPYQALLPEIIISLAACAILVLDQTQLKRYSVGYITSLATLAAAALVASTSIGNPASTSLNQMFIDDPLSNLIKVAVCLLTLIVFVYSRTYVVDRSIGSSEYYVLGLFGVLGMMVMASAGHLLVLYMGLELMSLCLYAMVAFQRDSSNATEASMKYFVLGAIASGCLLYGMSILYGVAGTLEIAAIHEAVRGMNSDNIALIFALVFVVVALAFKLGAAPFHMWVPDVYHGAPASTTLYLGAAPKIAAFAMLVRLLIGGLEHLSDVWQDMFIIIALLSIIIGNATAIVQSNIKRMLAYSTVAHMGYLLLGILSATSEGYAAALFYVLVYSVMGLGAFGMIVLFASKGQEADSISDYRGLNARNPWMALLMLLLMFSLAGVPPTVGFYAKFAVIQALVDAGLVWVAVVSVIFAVVGAFYYLRVIKVMYFDEAPKSSVPFSAMPGSRVLIAVNTIGLLVILPWVGGVLSLCKQAIDGLL